MARNPQTITKYGMELDQALSLRKHLLRNKMMKRNYLIDQNKKSIIENH